MEYLSLITVGIPGLFAIIVASITLLFANKREKWKYEQEQKNADKKEKQEMYIELISSLDKTMRAVKRGDNNSQSDNEISLISAKISLLASKKINDLLSDISILLYKWSSEYRQSLPKQVRDTNIGLISNLDFEHKEKADEIYPKMMKQIDKLVNVIKLELSELKKNKK